MARVGRTKAQWAATLVVAALVTLAFPARVAAATLTLTPTSGVPGDTVNAHGAGYPPNQPISVRWDDTLVATGNSGTERTGFDIPFQVPPAAPGGHVVTLCVTGTGPTGCGGASDTAPFTVVIPAVTPTPAPLPSLPPPPTPIPGASATAEPTLPHPTFPIGAETPSPEPPPIAVVTPAPTPPNQLDADPDDYPDLWIKAIEVTQGIQDLQNRMPLVEDRRTYARVYVGTIGEPSWPNTYGSLEARRNGEQIGWIWPENGPINAKAGAGSRVQVDDTLNFRLPEDWLHGEVTLRAFVYSYNVASVFDQEPEWQNNLFAVEVAFHAAQPLTVHLAPLHLHRSFHPDDVERTYDSDLDADLLPPGGSATLRIVNGLYRYHPLSQVNLDLLLTPITPDDHDVGHEFNMGGCQTTLVDWYPDDHVAITDWEPLMEDPDTFVPTVGQTMEADHKTLAILDRRIAIDFWGIVEEDGRIVVYGEVTGDGPQPLPGTPVFVGGCKPQPSTSAEPNQTLAIYRAFYDWDDEEDLFVGMVHPSLPTLFGGQSTGGTDAVWVRMRDTVGGTSTWWHTGAETLAHEAGHAAGLKHVPCKDGDADNEPDGVPDELKGGAIDPSHPNALTFPNCALADVDPEGWYGFDVYWSLFGLAGPTPISNNPDQAAPNRAWPFLSYRDPGWADPYHYCRLLDFYGVPCDPTDLGIPWSEPDAPAGGPLTAPPDPTHDDLPPGATGLIGLRGSIDPVAGTASMGGAFFLDEPTTAALKKFSGQYVVAQVTHHVVVLDAAGNELASVPIQHQDMVHTDATTIDFEALVPVFPQAHVYQLRSTDHEFIRLEISANAPTVTWGPITQETDTFGRVKVQLHWDASDADGDPLTYTLLYAPDGEHWQVLAAGLTEPGFEVYLDTLPSGPAPKWSINAFDWNSAASAVTEVVVPVPGLPPSAVVSGLTSRTHPSGADVVLQATAFDPEDRTLSSEAISWSSSLDGDLGTGSELVVDDLSAGTHTITAMVTDSDGLTDTSSFELEIDGSVVQPRPDPAVVSAIDAIFAAVAAGEDPATAYQDTTTFGDLAPWLILVAIAAAAAGRGFLVWRSRSGHKLA